MRARTLTNLIADVRRVADIEGLTARHPDANLTREINQSINAFRLMISAWSDYYVTNFSWFTATPGSEIITTGAALGNIIRLYGMDVLVDGKWRELSHFSLADRNRYQTGTATTGIPTHFRETASTSAATRSIDIILMPVPNSDYTLRPWMLSKATDLSAGSDQFDGITGWEDWVIYDAAIRCATRDSGINDNYELLTAELGRIQARIEKEAKSLIIPGASYRHDTRGRRLAVEQASRFNWWEP